MVPVTEARGGRPRAPGRRGHAASGLFGLGVVAALFLLEYPAIVGLTDETLGLLSSTAIVWLFVTSWGLCWLGLDVVLLQWASRDP